MKKHRFKVEWIALKNLRVHPRVQRVFDEAHARRMAADFDIDGLGTLSVVKINDRYFVFDGQHRRWAAIDVFGEDTTVPCHVYEDLTDKECAAIALRLNKTKAWRAIDTFLQRVLKGDTVAVDINRIIQRHGLKVANAFSPGIVRAVTACEFTYLKCSPAVFDRTLRLLKEAWGQEAEAFDQTLIKGLGMFLERHEGEIDEPHLLRRLIGHVKPISLMGNVRQFAKISQTTVTRAAEEMFCREYNKGLRGARRLGDSREVAAA